MNEIYLDYAATTPVLPETADAVYQSMVRDFGNPSSLHRKGIEAEKAVKGAKEALAAYIGVSSEEVFFTSGGTEANNLAIFGTAAKRARDGRHIITTEIEHPSVLAAYDHLRDQGFRITRLPVKRDGVVSLDALKDALAEDTVLISIMHVNNEIGTIQPLAEIGALLTKHPRHPAFHVDAIQSLGKIKVQPRAWGVDLMAFSGHKIHALKGIGALYVRKGTPLQPLIYGGSQEGGLRSGTQNMPGIISMEKAVRWLHQRDPSTLMAMKRRLTVRLTSTFPLLKIWGPEPEQGAPHILNVSIPGIRGEVLLHALEDRGVYVSTGSACSSRRGKVSHVLKAIGADTKAAEGAIRLSWSYTTTQEELDAFISILSECIEQLKRYTRRS